MARISFPMHGIIGRVTDSENTPEYVWFRALVLALVPDVNTIPVFSTLDAAADAARDFVNKRIKWLLTATIVPFMEEDERDDMFGTELGGVPFDEDDEKQEHDLFDSVVVMTGAIKFRPFADDNDDNEDDFSRSIARALLRDPRSVMLWLRTAKGWPFIPTEFTEMLFYWFWIRIKTAYIIFQRRESSRKRHLEEDVMLQEFAAKHRAKRPKFDAFEEHLDPMDEEGGARVDIPLEIRLSIARYLPARDALRLILQTQKAHPDMVVSIIMMLMQRDFLNPLDARLTEEKFVMAKLSLYGVSVAKHFARKRKNIPWIRLYIFFVSYMARRNITSPRAFFQAVPAVIPLEDGSETPFFASHAAEMDFALDFTSPTNYLLPFYRVAGSNLASLVELADNDEAVIFYAGDSGLQFKLLVKHEGAPADFNHQKIVLVQDTPTHDMLPLVIACNRMLRRRGANEPDTAPASSPFVGSGGGEGWNILEAFMTHILVALDPTLTGFMQTRYVKRTSVVHKYGVRQSAQHRQAAAYIPDTVRRVNLLMTSMYDGGRIRGVYDPAISDDTRFDESIRPIAVKEVRITIPFVPIS